LQHCLKRPYSIPWSFSTISKELLICTLHVCSALETLRLFALCKMFIVIIMGSLQQLLQYKKVPKIVRGCGLNSWNIIRIQLSQAAKARNTATGITSAYINPTARTYGSFTAVAARCIALRCGAVRHRTFPWSCSMLNTVSCSARQQRATENFTAGS